MVLLRPETAAEADALAEADAPAYPPPPADARAAAWAWASAVEDAPSERAARIVGRAIRIENFII
jgi:hypothetical protein